MDDKLIEASKDLKEIDLHYLNNHINKYKTNLYKIINK